jgi:hypothetical protein
MKLSTIRDLALTLGVTGGAIAIGAAVADDLTDLFAAQRRRLRRNCGPLAVNSYGSLYLVGGFSRETYVRPATEPELTASEQAAGLDGGPGVFAVRRNDDGTTSYVFPGDDAWDNDLADRPGLHVSSKLAYYRVGD